MMSLQRTYRMHFNKIEDSIQAIHMICLYERKGEFLIKVFRKPCGLLEHLVLYPSVVFVAVWGLSHSALRSVTAVTLAGPS